MNYLSGIVGIQYRPEIARNRAQALAIGDTVTLKREPDCPQDENAIQVLADDLFVGYVQRAVASTIAPLMDDGQSPTATVFAFGDMQSRNWPHATPMLEIEFEDPPSEPPSE